MDAAVIKFYRKMLKDGFAYAGSIEKPSIYLNTVREGISICNQAGTEYIYLYLNILDDSIHNIKYLCACDPTANVVIESLCLLVEGKSLSEALAMAPESFFQIIGSDSEEVAKKVKGALKLLHRGIERYQSNEPKTKS